MSCPEKIERNIEIYVARKKGATYRVLSQKYDLSQARVQQLIEIMEKKLGSMPQLAELITDKNNKYIIEGEK